MPKGRSRQRVAVKKREVGSFMRTCRIDIVDGRVLGKHSLGSLFYTNNFGGRSCLAAALSFYLDFNLPSSSGRTACMDTCDSLSSKILLFRYPVNQRDYSL